MDERRRATRHPRQIPVELTLHGDSFAASIRNISTGGLMIDFGERQPVVGDELEASFRLPNIDAPAITGVVVRWVDSIRNELAGVEYTTGLRAREVYEINQLHKEA